MRPGERADRRGIRADRRCDGDEMDKRRSRQRGVHGGPSHDAGEVANVTAALVAIYAFVFGLPVLCAMGVAYVAFRDKTSP